MGGVIDFIHKYITRPIWGPIEDIFHDPSVLGDWDWWWTPQGGYADWLTPDIPNSPTYASNHIGNTISEGLFESRCYGLCKIGGNKLRFNAADATDLRIIVAHCMGPVAGITEWYVNDIAWDDLTGSHSYSPYTGTWTQTADARFDSRASAYRGTAYTAFTFVKNDKQVGYDPTITCTMEGLLCLPLAGGADAFTRNPAVILYDWYRNVEGYLDKNLVGWWNLDEGSGSIAHDLSGNGNDGTLVNMEDADWVDGVVGKCLDFDGSNEYINIGDVLDFGAADSFSVSHWILPGEAAVTNDQFMGKYDGTGYETFLEGNYARFYIRDGANVAYRFNASVNIKDGEWHHIVGVVDRSAQTLRTYVDGIDSGTMSTTAVGDLTTVAHLRIGYCNAHYTPGKIDEVRIYDRALTASEIKALYDNPGGKLDTLAFRSLEALCDEVPAGSSLPRYRFDFNFDTNMTINDAKKLLWQSFNGQVIMSQGKYKCVWDSAQMADGSGGLTAKTVSHAFTEDNIVKGSLTWDQPEPPNIVRIHYIDAANSYQKTSVEERDENDIEINGEIPYEEICYYITDAELARRRAKFKFNKFKYENYNCKLTAFSGAGDLEIYDLCTVTHTLPGWDTKQFIVASKGENQNGQPTFTLRAYYSGVYDDAQVGAQDGYESVLPNPYQVPAASTAISAAMTAVGTSYDFDAVRVSFTPPITEPFYSYSEIYASNDDANYYYVGRDGTGVFTFNALGVIYEPGETCYIKIRSVSTMDVPEDLPGAADAFVVVTATMRLAGFYAGTNDFWGGNAAIDNAATTIVLGNLDGTPKIALGATADTLSIANMSTYPGFFADGEGNVRGGNAGGGFVATGGTFTVTGALSAATIDIGGDDATSFHVDIDGNIWSGASIANKATAPFRVSSAGALVATSATIGGAISGATIEIGGNDASSFHADIDGGIWSGASIANKATAPFRVSNAGALVATSATITGDITATTGNFHAVTLGETGVASGTLTFQLHAENGDTYLNYGKTDFTNADAGFILGIDDSDGDKGKFYIGDADHYLNWDGAALTYTKGTLVETIIQMYTDVASLKTSATAGDGSADSTGVVVTYEGIFGCGANQTATVAAADANVRILATGAAFFTGTITAAAGNIAGFYIGANDLWGGNAAIGNAATTIVLGNLDGTSKLALGASADAITVAGDNAGFIVDGAGEIYCGNGLTEYWKYTAAGGVAISTAQASAITVKSGGGILIEQGGNLKLDGGDIYLDTLSDDPDYYYPEIFWRDHNDATGCVMTLDASLYKGYPNIKIDSYTYSKDIILVADRFDFWASDGGRMYLGSGTFLIQGIRNAGISLDQTANDRVTLAGNIVISTGLHIGGTSNAGANNLLVDGLTTLTGNLLVNGGDIGIAADTNLLQLAANALTVNGAMTVTDYLAASGGVHVGGTSDPGEDNLVVDGYTKLGITDVDGTVEGQIWYDASEDKLKFKTAAGVETITSV